MAGLGFTVFRVWGLRVWGLRVLGFGVYGVGAIEPQNPVATA